MSLQLLGPSALELEAHGGFFQEENIIILEESSIVNAVRYEESKYLPGCLLILSDNPPLPLTRSNICLLLSVVRRIFTSVFWTDFVLSFRWMPSESNYSDNGSRFLDRDCDPSKSLLHVLAQRLPRFPHAQTGDRECFSPSLMQLDGDEVGRICRVHLPAVSVQSHAPSDDLSSCAGHDDDGHTGAVSSQCSSVISLHRRFWKADVSCFFKGSFENPMGHVSWVPSTWCGLPPDLVGSQLLDESQMQWSSAGSGTEARYAQSLTKIDENCPTCSISGPSSRRQVPVE